MIGSDLDATKSSILTRRMVNSSRVEPCEGSWINERVESIFPVGL